MPNLSSVLSHKRRRGLPHSVDLCFGIHIEKKKSSTENRATSVLAKVKKKKNSYAFVNVLLGTLNIVI